jgi:peptide subunit release factor 1 (eRF1)
LHFWYFKTQSKQSKQSKAQSKTQHSSSHHGPKMTSPIRASTISHLKQQIGSKLKKLRAVLENPKKNFVVMAGQMLHNRHRHTRSHSHSQKSPNKRNYTRKVRSAL